MQSLVKSKGRKEEIKETILELGVLTMSANNWSHIAERKVQELKEFPHLMYRCMRPIKE